MPAMADPRNPQRFPVRGTLTVGKRRNHASDGSWHMFWTHRPSYSSSPASAGVLPCGGATFREQGLFVKSKISKEGGPDASSDTAGARTHTHTHTAVRVREQTSYSSVFFLRRCVSVILSPKLSATPCVFDRMRMWPRMEPSGRFSTETFTSASSPAQSSSHGTQQHTRNRHACTRRRAET